MADAAITAEYNLDRLWSEIVAPVRIGRQEKQ